MNTEKERRALELLNDIVQKYEHAIALIINGYMHAFPDARREALGHCTELKKLLAASVAEPAPTSTVWVGLAPATIVHLLIDNAEFGRQYEERNKTPGKQFTGRDGMAIEFIGTELGLCLGVKLLILREGLTRLSLPNIIFLVEEAKEKFAAAMETLGVPDTKELLEVFVKTK